MTIVIGVAAPDGVILAADSRTTYTRGEHHRVASDTSHKLFAVRGRFAVATYGISFVDGQTIAGQMDEFVAQLDPALSEVRPFADALGKFFDERVKKEYTEEELKDVYALLGFLVAGYDGAGIGQLLEVSLPGPEISGEINTGSIGTLWRGQTDVVRRLIKGIDWSQLDVGEEKLSDAVQKGLENLEYNLLSPITLQDGVDFATFLIRTTIDMQRFSDGLLSRPGSIPGCGGQISVLAVTRAGTEWVEQPMLAAAATER